MLALTSVPSVYAQKTLKQLVAEEKARKEAEKAAAEAAKAKEDRPSSTDGVQSTDPVIEADLTEEWLGENMDPHNLMAYQIALLAALSRESESEAAKEESENHERDLVLEEIQKKKDPANSHTGGSSTGD